VDIVSTGVSTLKTLWTETELDTSQGYKTTSFLATDGLSVQFDSNHRYITSYDNPNYSRKLIDQTLSPTEFDFFVKTYRLPNNIDYNSITNATSNNGQ